MSKGLRQNKLTSPLACDMTAIPLSERETHMKSARDLFSETHEIRELPDGYEFRLNGDAEAMLKATQFISLEKLCCPFLAFSLKLEADGGPLWLTLTGREGVKAFIREEINGLLGVAIEWEMSPPVQMSDEL